MYIFGAYAQSFSIMLLGIIPIPILFMALYVPVLWILRTFKEVRTNWI